MSRIQSDHNNVIDKINLHNRGSILFAFQTYRNQHFKYYIGNKLPILIIILNYNFFVLYTFILFYIIFFPTSCSAIKRESCCNNIHFDYPAVSVCVYIETYIYRWLMDIIFKGWVGLK